MSLSSEQQEAGFIQECITFEEPIVQSLSFSLFESDLDALQEEEKEERDDQNTPPPIRNAVPAAAQNLVVVVPRDSICMREFLVESQQQHLDVLFLLKKAHASVETTLNSQGTTQKEREEPLTVKKSWWFLKRFTSAKSNMNILPNRQEVFADDDRFLRLKRNSFDMITDHIEHTCRHSQHLTKNLQSMAKIMQEMSTSKHIRDHQKSLMNGSIGLYELSFWFEEELLRKKLQPKKKELYQFQALLDRRDQLKQKLSSKAKISKQKNIPKSKQKYETSHFSLKKTTETNDSMTSQINHLHAVSCEIERVFRMHRHLDSYIIEQETTQVRHALGQAFQDLATQFP